MKSGVNFNINCNCTQWCPRKLKINCAGCAGDDVTPVAKTIEVAREIFESEKVVENKKKKCTIL
jgi:dissimilatory sulfite reductase (desulfoviridin) alpha/beta subunit